MANIQHNHETQYVESRKYKLKSGETKIAYYVFDKKLKGTPKGRPKKLPNTNTVELKKLRDAGLSWKKIGIHLNITAYQSKRIYESLSESPLVGSTDSSTDVSTDSSDVS